MFSTLSKTKFHFFSHIYAFNLEDLSKIMSFGKEFKYTCSLTCIKFTKSTSFQPRLASIDCAGRINWIDIFVDSFFFSEYGFADDKLKVSRNIKFVFHRVGNIMGKEEYAVYQIFCFSLGPTMLAKGLFSRVIEIWECVIKD